MCFFEWLGRLKCRATDLDVSRNRLPSRLPVSLMYSFLHNLQVMQQITFAKVHGKLSVILTDRLGPDILSGVLNKRTSLALRARAFKGARLLLIICFECASDQKVVYISVAFKRNVEKDDQNESLKNENTSHYEKVLNNMGFLTV